MNWRMVKSYRLAINFARKRVISVKTILIRKLEKDDISPITTIYGAITGKQPSEDFTSLIKKNVGREKGVCDVDIAEIDGKVIGFMVSYILILGFGLEKSAWIATLGVDPDYMGQGVGEKLAKEVFYRCQKMGITEVHTSVVWDSTDLLSFFKSLGFDRSSFINLHKKL
jgi:N-acetylglutamate synthase-like GNAT family acetyltransferase